MAYSLLPFVLQIENSFSVKGRRRRVAALSYVSMCFLLRSGVPLSLSLIRGQTDRRMDTCYFARQKRRARKEGRKEGSRCRVFHIKSDGPGNTANYSFYSKISGDHAPFTRFVHVRTHTPYRHGPPFFARLAVNNSPKRGHQPAASVRRPQRHCGCEERPPLCRRRAVFPKYEFCG